VGTRSGCRSLFVVRRWTRDTILALFFALASLALYAATAAPSVATLFDDSLEFQVVLPTLGIAHPSGYPLYTLLGRLWTLLLPLRDPAGRANLLSAVAAAAAVGVFFLVARRLAGSRPAAVIATVALIISPTWWSQATIAEVYALHGLLVALFLYCLLRWEGTPVAAGRRQVAAGGAGSSSFQLPASNTRWLAAAALVAGLGLTHHHMIALLAPAALVFVIRTDPSLLRRPRRWLPLLLCALAPLLFYLYLPIRGRVTGSLDGIFTPTAWGTLDWLLARGYSVFLTSNPFGVSRGLGTYLSLFPDQFGVLLCLGALPGLAIGWRQNARRYVLLLLATAAQIAFGAAYKVQDIDVFFIPAFMLVALWAAWGMTILVQWLESILTRYSLLITRYSLLITLSLSAIVLVQPAVTAIRAFPQQDRSRAWGVYDYGADMLANIAPGGEVVGLLGETTLLRYFRDVLGQRPDISVVPADAETDRFAAVDTALAAGRPVYLTRDLPGAAARYSLDAAGPLIAVSPKAAPAVAPAGRPIGAGIVLVDARGEVRWTHAGPVVRLTLTWAATAPVAEELKVSARLLDEAGQVVAADDRVPVHFAYPTTAWAPGEQVQDVYDLTQPAGAAGGPYGVLLILYRVADGGEVGRAELSAVTVGGG